MNSYAKLTVLLCLAAAVFTVSCRRDREAATPADIPRVIVMDAVPQFSDVMDRDWNLITLRRGSETTEIDRGAFAEVFGEVFTLRFEEERISGVGFPNLFFGPYTLEDNQAISIQPPASSLMAAIFEMEELREHEYFAYLQNVYRWNLIGGNLELHTRGEDGTETVLVFAQ